VARRILIKGASGAGKSTLGRELAARLDLPRVELDALHHGPGWTAASAPELRARVAAALDDERGWVVDGNYDTKLGTLLWERAELIVWLDLPLRLKLLRLVGRTARRLMTREELWNGNRESLKEAFVGGDALFPWAVRAHFLHRRSWPPQLAHRPHVRLKTPAEVEAWLSDFCGEGLT
jgi:adenylate kinase family enzyme